MLSSVTVPARQIRARFTDETITVYQAYRAEIALPAVSAISIVIGSRIRRPGAGG